MRPYLFLSLLFGSLLLAMNPSFAQQTLVLGTATPGGGFPVFGEAFAAMVNAQEPALRIEPRNTSYRGCEVPEGNRHAPLAAALAGEPAFGQSRDSGMHREHAAGQRLLLQIGLV